MLHSVIKQESTQHITTETIFFVSEPFLDRERKREVLRLTNRAVLKRHIKHFIVGDSTSLLIWQEKNCLKAIT